MKNWEFYEEQIKNNPAFAVVGGEVVECIPTNCPKCSIKNIRCYDERIRFLYQDYKESVVLTDDEKALCKLLCGGWIARDLDGKLWWYKKKPIKGTVGSWLNRSVSVSEISSPFPQCKFNFIEWEDEEPWEVKVDD